MEHKEEIVSELRASIESGELNSWEDVEDQLWNDLFNYGLMDEDPNEFLDELEFDLPAESSKKKTMQYTVLNGVLMYIDEYDEVFPVNNVWQLPDKATIEITWPDFTVTVDGEPASATRTGELKRLLLGKEYDTGCV